MYSSIAVFCGSKSGNLPVFEQHAQILGKLMAQNNIRLVYGGGSVGIMGAIANSVMQHGGEVIGVIPEVLANREQSHQGITDLRVVPDMHVRKRMMYKLCDAAIILPGGVGTMDELFEMYTWNNLKIHSKKIILLNSAGFYNQLIGHLDAMTEGGFMYDDWRSRLLVFDNPEAIFAFWDANKS